MKLEASPVGDGKDGTGSVTVGCAKDSVVRTNERKGKA
jgi:hypothetical protein